MYDSALHSPVEENNASALTSTATSRLQVELDALLSAGVLEEGGGKDTLGLEEWAGTGKWAGGKPVGGGNENVFLFPPFGEWDGIFPEFGEWAGILGTFLFESEGEGLPRGAGRPTLPTLAEGLGRCRGVTLVTSTWVVTGLEEGGWEGEGLEGVCVRLIRSLSNGGMGSESRLGVGVFCKWKTTEKHDSVSLFRKIQKLSSSKRTERLLSYPRWFLNSQVKLATRLVTFNSFKFNLD